MRSYGRLCMLLMIVALVLGMMTPAMQATADDRITYIYYVEVFGPPDPSMGGNQPLIDSGDSSVAPTYNDIRYTYGDAVTGGGGYTVIIVEFDSVTNEVIGSDFHSAGDFP